MAYDRHWSRTVVINVRLSLHLAAILDLILFPFPLTHAEKLVIDRLISIGLIRNVTSFLDMLLLFTVLWNRNRNRNRRNRNFLTSGTGTGTVTC